jgi:hypothetical protein
MAWQSREVMLLYFTSIVQEAEVHASENVPTAHIHRFIDPRA